MLTGKLNNDPTYKSIHTLGPSVKKNYKHDKTQEKHCTASKHIKNLKSLRSFIAKSQDVADENRNAAMHTYLDGLTPTQLNDIQVAIMQQLEKLLIISPPP